jgi:molybdopterin/thiamine biosynthesis adenylyltransferase
MGPAAACLASLQAAEALKLLLGAEDALLPGMLVVELWPPRFRLAPPPEPRGCPDCGGGAG